MSQSNTAVAQRWTEEIWNKGNMSAVTELVTEDFVFHGLMEDLRGHAALKDTVTLIRKAFPDGGFTNDETIAERDKVVQRWTFKGTHKDQFFGAAGTGKRVAFPGITILRIAAGKVAEHWGYFDLTGFLRQVGKTLS